MAIDILKAVWPFIYVRGEMSTGQSPAIRIDCSVGLLVSAVDHTCRTNARIHNVIPAKCWARGILTLLFVWIVLTAMNILVYFHQANKPITAPTVEIVFFLRNITYDIISTIKRNRIR
jgi:hypothetical protein